MAATRPITEIWKGIVQTVQMFGYQACRVCGQFIAHVFCHASTLGLAIGIKYVLDRSLSVWSEHGQFITECK